VLRLGRGKLLKRTVFRFIRILLALAAIICGGKIAAAEDYAARYKQLREEKAPAAQIDSLLDEWRAKQSEDPEAWITSANYYFNESLGTVISTDPAEKGKFDLKDKKTGKKAGSIVTKPEVAKTSRSATDILREATTKFPDRLDIWCGLAWMNQEAGNFNDEFDTLQNMVGYAREHPEGLKWLKGQPLNESADIFIAEKLHEYGTYYEKKENPKDDDRFLKIAMFSAEQFPNHPYAFNDVAVYYSIKGDNAKTREWLEKANKIDPRDTLVMTNLGYVCSKLGDNAAARKWYEAVIKADPNGEHAARAKQGLAKLKK
jgi:tetratricopeptide (TPR) repeat protein